MASVSLLRAALSATATERNVVDALDAYVEVLLRRYAKEELDIVKRAATEVESSSSLSKPQRVLLLQFLVVWITACTGRSELAVKRWEAAVQEESSVGLARVFDEWHQLIQHQGRNGDPNYNLIVTQAKQAFIHAFDNDKRISAMSSSAASIS